MARFISVTKEDIHQQYQYLLFLRQVVVPMLGPYPPIRRSCMNATQLPVELSLQFRGPGCPVFRTSLDPMSQMTGTPMDPMNIDTVNGIIARLASMDLKGFDRTLHSHFTREFSMPEQRMRSYQQDTGEARAWSQTVLGFDFKDGNVVTKQYIWTRQTTHMTGLHPHALIRRALSPLEDQMRCATAVNQVLEYMETFNAAIPVPFFSYDLVEPAKSRVKLYGVGSPWSWAKVQEVYTLGGKMKGPVIDRGIDLLRKLWDILKMDDFTPSLPLTWNYEIRPGQADPNVRIYWPMSDRTDLEMAQAISQWFELLGWHELARSYPETLQYLQPNRDLKNTRSAHTWLSILISEEGPSTSVYYHPLGNGPDNYEMREKWF